MLNIFTMIIKPNALCEQYPHIRLTRIREQHHEYHLEFYTDDTQSHFVGSAVWHTRQQRMVLCNVENGNQCRAVVCSNQQLLTAIRQAGLYRAPKTRSWKAKNALAA